MANEAGLGTLKKTAMFKRLAQAEKLLQRLFLHTLKFSADACRDWNGLKVVAVDATCLSGPGATGTDQRLHTVYDLSKGLPRSVEITDVHGGETMVRHTSFGAGDLVLSDAGYGYNKSFLWALKSGASVLMRFNFQTVTLLDEDRNRIWADEINELMPETGSLDLAVYLPGWDRPLRAVGSRNPEGIPVWLLTDLSEQVLPTPEVRELYRLRWQVELYFKRLKSLVDLDELKTRDGPTARPWIWAKLTLASLAVLMAHERFSPSGYPERETKAESLGTTRLRDMPRMDSDPHSRPKPKERTAKGEGQATKTRKNAKTALPLEG
jgi:Transposase DDE domain